jgi:hypothetical protein
LELALYCLNNRVAFDGAAKPAVHAEAAPSNGNSMAAAAGAGAGTSNPDKTS